MKRTAIVICVLALFFSTFGTSSASTRDAGRDPIIYFVMVDRFANGDPSNDQGGVSGGRDVTGADPSDPGFFHGGDLVGLRERLDHIASLGFTAIWITPVVRQVPLSPTGESAAYHGYWGAGFDQVDPRFGTMDEMKALVRAAHAREMKVYLDVVVNHTGDAISYQEGEAYLSLREHPYRRSDGKRFNSVKVANTPSFPSLQDLEISTSFPKKVILNPEIKKSPEWLNDPRNYHNRGNFSSSGESSTYGDFYGLDDLFTESPIVEDGMVQVFSDWIRDVGVDGFRLDTFKHVNPEFWQGFLTRIMATAEASGKSDFPMWGEIYDYDPGRITEWSKRTGLREVLDFPIQGAIAGYVIDEDVEQLARVFDNDDLYTTASTDASRNGTFLGNHDMGRIGGFIYNRFRDGDVALAKLEIAHALLYSIRGVPIVYYGDEFGMIGGRDKAARQSLFPTKVKEWQREPRIGMESIGEDSYFDRSHPLHETLRELASIRGSHPGLRDGYQSLRYSKEGMLAVTRVDDDSKSELLFLFNATEKSASIRLPSTKEFSLMRGDAKVRAKEITVPALSWSYLSRPVRSMTSKPKVTLLEPGRYKYDPSLFFFRAEVERMTFAAVRFEFKGSDGIWKSMGTDTSPVYGKSIYRIAPPRATLPSGKTTRIRAVGIDHDGSEVRSKALLLRLPK
ncbi:MAG: alpha-amylase family glycosyl hydrolase [Candidatus Nanopelagicaceae bacterium]